METWKWRGVSFNMIQYWEQVPDTKDTDLAFDLLDNISKNNTGLKYDVNEVQLYPVYRTNGLFNYTDMIVETSPISTFTEKNALFFDVSAFDSLTILYTVSGNLSTADKKRPSISIIRKGTPVFYQNATDANVPTVVNLSDIADKEGLIAVVNANQSKEPIVTGSSVGFITKANNARLSAMRLIKGCDDVIKEDDIKEGVWNYTADELRISSGDIKRNKVYFFNDIASYDMLIVNGASNGSSLSTSSVIIPSLSLYDGDNKVDYKQIETTEDTEIDLSAYKEHLNLRAIILCEKNGSIMLRGISSGLISNMDNMNVEISNNSQSIVAINAKINGTDENIFSALFANLKNGWWRIDENHPNGYEHAYNSVQRTRCTDKIDITAYESVTLKGLFNGGPLSNLTAQYEACAIYGDDRYIGHIRNISTEASNIFLSDYKQYKKVEIILNIKLNESLDGPEFADNIIRIYSTGINKESVVKRLVICGDSLCGNTSALIVKEFNSILAAQGYDPIIARTMGGENIIGNLTRAGGLGIRVKSPFTIPASGPVECALESQWILKSGGYAQTPYNGLPNGGTNVTICGISGTLEKASTNAVGIAFYTSEQTFVSSLSDNGTYNIPDNADFYRFTINDPQTGEAHITIDEDAVDITLQATQNGYINNSGTYVSASGYKCSDYIAISGKKTIYIDSLATSTGYKFTRKDSGESVKVGIGEVFFDNALYDDRDYPHIWFTGQNGGYTDEEEWADMIKSTTCNLGDKYIVCSTALTRTTDELVRQANIHFGTKYLNLRAYTQGQAVYDGQKMGLINEQYNANDYEELFWPGADKIHQNNLLSYIWSVKMWNLMLDFGFVEGTKIYTGDYYMP